MNLYKGDNAKKFSETRNKAWEGWHKLISNFQFSISNESNMRKAVGGKLENKLNKEDQISNQQSEISDPRNQQPETRNVFSTSTLEPSPSTRPQTLDPRTSGRVLDLGCGNGRFLEFLKDNPKFSNVQIDYVGIDSSEELLEIAQDETRDSRLETSEEIGNGEEDGRLTIDDKKKTVQSPTSNVYLLADLESEDWDYEFTEKFDLIVGFGLMHHISSFEKRQELLKKCINLVSDSGLICFTYWQFAKDQKFLSKHVVKSPTELNHVGKFATDDYVLSFGKEDAQRFCHNFSDDEIAELYSDLKLKEVDKYLSDGFDNKMNCYVISQKI